MTTRVGRQSYWKDRRETKSKTKTTNEQRILRCRRVRAVPRCQGRVQNGAYARYPVYIWKDGKVVAEDREERRVRGSCSVDVERDR